MKTTRLLLAAGAASAVLAAGVVLFDVIKQNAPPARAPSAPTVSAAPPSYKTVANWAVSYDDSELGPVEGRATCFWKKRSCSVVFRNPSTNALVTLRSQSWGFNLPENPLEELTIPFSEGSPFGNPVPAPETPSHSIRASDGESAYIVVKNGDTELKVEGKVRKRAIPDTGVRAILTPQADGSLEGRWEYFANPLTRRPGLGGPGEGRPTYPGEGRAGFFTTLADDDLPALLADRQSSGATHDPGGFLGKQTGAEHWQPLPPRIYGVYMLEDQAAFTAGSAYFSLSRRGGFRTLIVVGRDLPPRGWDIDDADGVSYAANVTPDNATREQQQQFEQAWKALTSQLTSAEAADYRKLDAAMVLATVSGRAAPGPKKFNWGGADVKWDLQYGDNTADVRFIRMINDVDIERVNEFSMPDRVVVEVETANKIDETSIPVQIGGSLVRGSPTDALGKPIDLVATQVPGTPTLFRTPPFVVADPTDAPTGTVVLAPGGAKVYAGVNRDKTSFLSASAAAAWVNRTAVGKANYDWAWALGAAAKCNNVQFDPADWPNFAKKSAEHIRSYGQDADITYGDHAAALFLREALKQALLAQVQELTTAAGDVRLVDAWYRAMHDAVTQVTGYPLADYLVNGPQGGQVAFKQAYSEDFAETSFHISTTADGRDRYLTWRRAATGEAMVFMKTKILDAIDQADQVSQSGCDRQALIKFAASPAFSKVIGRTVPLLMKRRADSPVTEPDILARGYVKNLDNIQGRIESITKVPPEIYQKLVIGVLLLTPFGVEAAWTGVGLAGGEGIGTLVGLIGGFAIWGYDSAYEIYQTWQDHEEVQFAFGASSVLGLKNYFEAASRQRQWWATGATIFGGLVMNGVAARMGLKPIQEGLRAWRGQRIVSDLAEEGVRSIYNGTRVMGTVPDPSLSAMQKLPINDLFDVAMYTAKEEERIAAGGVFGQARQFTDWVYSKFAAQAGGQSAGAEEQLLSREMAMQAMNPPDDFKSTIPPPDSLRLAKTEETDTAFAARYAREMYEYYAAAEAGSASAPQVARNLVQENELPKIAKASEFTPWLPKPSRLWTREIVTEQGVTKTVTFDVDPFFYTDGSFAQVYKLRSLPPELGIKAEPGQAYTLKIIRIPREVEGFNGSPTLKQDVLFREIHGRDALAAKNLGQEYFWGFTGKIRPDEMEEYTKLRSTAQVPVTSNSAGVQDTFGIMIQRYIPFKEQSDKFVFVPEMKGTDGVNPAQWLAKFPKGQQDALLNYVNDAAKSDISLLDFNRGNFFLEDVGGGKWVVKCLDQDFITSFENVNQGVYADFMAFLRGNRYASSVFKDNPADPKYSTARSLMQKIMEHYKWLEFDPFRLCWKLNSRVSPVFARQVLGDLVYPACPN